jgi:preprotein translocase subunit SecD
LKRVIGFCAALLSCGAAWAEPPLLSLTFEGEIIRLSKDDIRSASAFDPDAGAFGVNIALMPDVIPKISALTARHVGTRGAVHICNDLVSQPMVMEPLHLRTFQVFGSTQEQVADWVVILTKGDCGKGDGRE